MTDLELPHGYDMEVVQRYAEEVERKRRREWSHKNPDKVLAQRERTYCRFLIRRGYTISNPEGVLIHE